MFYWDKKLIDVSALSGWITTNVTDMTRMFALCKELNNTSGLNNWNTSKVTSMN
jgi:surface protein